MIQGVPEPAKINFLSFAVKTGGNVYSAKIQKLYLPGGNRIKDKIQELYPAVNVGGNICWLLVLAARCFSAILKECSLQNLLQDKLLEFCLLSCSLQEDKVFEFWRNKRSLQFLLQRVIKMFWLILQFWERGGLHVYFLLYTVNSNSQIRSF